MFNLTKRKINYLKILANAGEVFFATFAGVATADALFKINIPYEQFLFIAAIPALLQAGINFCHELGESARESEPAANPNAKTRIVSIGLKRKLYNATGYFGVFS